MKDLLIITGPTAVGKTEISVNIARELEGEIISADSMQIYKHMDIGSAKISIEEMRGIRHHLIDIIEPNVSFSVSDFKALSEKCIEDITTRSKLPMLVGGTGLYINSLICNYNFTEAESDQQYREYLQGIAEENGKKAVHEMLKDVDIESYNRLFPNDLKRVIRALEVYKITGKTIGESNREDLIYDIPYRIFYFVLNMDRSRLYERINKRVDKMFEEGLIEEVKKLKDMGYTADMQAMKGIGYKEILYYLDGVITIDEAVEMIKQGTRNYAKRQLTWFRKDNRAVWINKDGFNNDGEIIDYIINEVKDKRIL